MRSKVMARVIEVGVDEGVHYAVLQPIDIDDLRGLGGALYREVMIELPAAPSSSQAGEKP